MRIVGPQTDEPLAPHTVGEIVVRPTEPWCFMAGYNARTDAESAAVTAQSDIAGGEDEVNACIVLRAGKHVTPEALLDYCQDRMPYFTIPHDDFDGMFSQVAVIVQGPDDF
jgi:hypothetical protein